MADDDDIKYIRGRLDLIAGKVSQYGEAITTCKDERDALFSRTSKMSTDITVLKTQKKTAEKSKSTILDIAIRVITVLCTIAFVVFWVIRLSRG